MSREEEAAKTALLSLLEAEPVVVMGPSGRITRWSRGAQALFEWTPEEAEGRTFASLVALEPASASEAAEDSERVRTATARTRSGRRVELEARCVSVAAGAEGFGARAWIGRDVTAARSGERRLRSRDERYRWLFQAMDAAFWHLDFREVGRMLRKARSDGVADFNRYFADHPEFVDAMMRATRVMDVNERTAALFGVRGEEADDDSSVAPYWPAESRPVFAGAVLAALGGQSVYVRETVLQALDGRRFHALFTACLPPEGVAEGVLLIGVVDISARVHAQRALEASEARQRSLVRHLPIPLVQLDMQPLRALLAERVGDDVGAALDGDPGLALEIASAVRIVDVNLEAQRLFGVRDGEALRGRDIAFAWKSRPETLRRSLLARLEGRAAFAEETQIDTLDGRTIDVLYTIAFDPALIDQGVNVAGFIDITERLATQRSISRLQADLAHAGRVAMLGELTASIAHEINQPLAAIATNASTGLRWLDRPDPQLDEVRDITRSIVADAHRAANTIQRIRSMASGARSELAQIDLCELVRDVLQFLAPEARTRAVSITTELPSGPVQATGDRTQIQQVVANLVLNALQALEGVSPAVRRLSVSVEAAGDEASVTVRDNGPGLSPDSRERVFEAFFTTRPDGMGMGLAICRGIVEAHGGAIGLAPAAGSGGAAFSFTLPLWRQPQEGGEGTGVIQGVSGAAQIAEGRVGP